MEERNLTPGRQSRRRWLFLGAVLLILAVAVGGALAAGAFLPQLTGGDIASLLPQAPATQAPGTLAYRTGESFDSPFSLSLYYPEAWEIEEDEGIVQFTSMLDDPEEGLLFAFGTGGLAELRGRTAEEVLKGISATQFDPDSRRSDIKPTRIGGKQAAELFIEIQQDSPLNAYFAIVDVDGTGMLVGAVSGAPSWDRHWQEFHAVIESMRFQKVQK